MSSITDILNTLLNPVIHQVIGSTPESMVNFIKDAGLKGNKENALRLAAISIFAAAVNKSTMEAFLITPELAPVRNTIMNSFSISGRTNMTALTLLGHCILTTDRVDDVVFAKEFRNKMGQKHLWAGSLDSGSLSEKQKGIMKEKKRNIAERSAMLFGSGFWKYTGVNTETMSYEEATFWRETYVQREAIAAQRVFQQPITFHRQSPSNQATVERAPVVRTTPKPVTASLAESSQRRSPPDVKAYITPGVPGTTNFNMTDGSVVALPADVVDYYLRVSNNDITAMEKSLVRNGADAWIDKYARFLAADPDAKGNIGSSVVG